MTPEILPYGNKDGRKHAIASMAFGLEFAEELGSDQLRQIASIRDELVELLPGVREKKSLKIDVNTPSKAMAEESLGAIVFESVRRDGSIARSLTISSNSAFVNVNDYVSWADAWEFAKVVFGKVLPGIVRQTLISCVGLQYVDRFISYCDVGSFDSSKVFDRNSSMLPSIMFDFPGPWHSNNGYFVNIEEPFVCNVLNNVNASLAQHQEPYGEKKVFSQVEINFIHRALISESPRSFIEADGREIGDDLEILMSSIHDLHKDIFSKIITKNMSESIGLTD